MRRERWMPLSEINVTNLVDVTLVLLIIFMITAPTIRKGISVNLPKAVASTLKFQNCIIVTLNAEGKVFLDQEPVQLDDLEIMIIKQHNARPQAPILLQADQNIQYGLVIDVMDRLKKAGISDIGLVVEPGHEQ
jgi:biopolymer transport protein TolR